MQRISIRNIVFSCPDGTWTGERWEGPPRDLALFYARLLGMRIVREDWLVIARDEESNPRLAFDELKDYRPPRPDDPEHPAQVHLDIAVHDVDEAGREALGLGATLLGTETDRAIYTDPAGHPLCLYADQGPDTDGGSRRIDRIVFDCFSPRALASFWGPLLQMERTEDGSEYAEIAGDPSIPKLAFRHVDSYRPPRWPDPAFPQQIHLDLDVEDGPAVQRRAEGLGAIRLPDLGGSCPVYADPAAHPFCLCAPDQ